MTAGRRNTSTRKDWGTPQKYVEAVMEVFGGRIGLDPCSGRHSITRARRSYSLPVDGLSKQWDSPTVYVNPPYGADRRRGTRISDWLEKCAVSREEYNSQVIALVPVATNTRHWKRSVFGRADGICFLYDTRLRFLVNGAESARGAPMACAMIYWGGRLAAFRRVLSRHGAVVSVRDLK